MDGPTHIVPTNNANTASSSTLNQCTSVVLQSGQRENVWRREGNPADTTQKRIDIGQPGQTGSNEAQRRMAENTFQINAIRGGIRVNLVLQAAQRRLSRTVGEKGFDQSKHSAAPCWSATVFFVRRGSRRCRSRHNSDVELAFIVQILTLSSERNIAKRGSQ